MVVVTALRQLHYCEAVSEVIYTPVIEELFNITRLERDRNASDIDIVDKLGIFEMVYEIDWYPSFFWFLTKTKLGKWLEKPILTNSKNKL